MSSQGQKKVFLIATGNSEHNRLIESTLLEHFSGISTFTAVDGIDAHFKAENVTPHVVIADYRLSRMTAISLTEKLIHSGERIAVIILSPAENKEHFIDEIVTGQVQFLTSLENVKAFVGHVNRALNWAMHEEKSFFRIKFLSKGDLLLREGEEGDHVYFVKHGKLEAVKTINQEQVLLGFINPGEFVGEMAYINGEPRSADVTCLTDVELIEIPSGQLDSILFSRPAWSRALMRTLSRRLKTLNEKQTGS